MEIVIVLVGASFRGCPPRRGGIGMSLGYTVEEDEDEDEEQGKELFELDRFRMLIADQYPGI